MILYKYLLIVLHFKFEKYYKLKIGYNITHQIFFLEMNTPEEEKLKAEMLDLKKKYAICKRKYFILRLWKLLKPTAENMKTIQNIKIYMQNDKSDQKWYISYLHHTDNYNVNDYILHEDSEVENEDKAKDTNITFGYETQNGKPKYYIKGNSQTRFKVYRTNKKSLSIVNTDYDVDLDIDEQTELIEKYSNNNNIPEWLALKILLYFRENEWENSNIVAYFSIC